MAAVGPFNPPRGGAQAAPFRRVSTGGAVRPGRRSAPGRVCAFDAVGAATGGAAARTKRLASFAPSAGARAALRGAIIALALAPGEALREPGLCAARGVSRSPGRIEATLAEHRAIV